jgi:hypothetical protein
MSDGKLIMSDGKLIALGVFIVVGAITTFMFGWPMYNVWASGKSGQAALAEAQFERQTLVVQSQSKLEAAALDAQAEVVRAHGAASSTQIIGESLQNNEAYLRYLWIQDMQTTDKQLLYVPTEAELPV